MAQKNIKENKKITTKYPDEHTKIFAFLGVFLTIIGFIIVYASRKKDEYAMFYSKQGLIMFFVWIISTVIVKIFSAIPIFGKIVEVVVYAFVLALWVISIIYALSDKKKEVPLLGFYAKKIEV